VVQSGDGQKTGRGYVRLAPDQLAIGEDEVQPWIFTLNVGVKKNKTYKLFASSPLDKQTWLREIRTVTFGKAHAAAAEDKTRGTISTETHIDPSEPTVDGFEEHGDDHDHDSHEMSPIEPSSAPASEDGNSPWGGASGDGGGFVIEGGAALEDMFPPPAGDPPTD